MDNPLSPSPRRDRRRRRAGTIVMVTATSAQPQAAGPTASTVERGACPGNRRLPFAGWTLVTAGVAANATRIQGSRPASKPGSEGSISYRVLAAHPDSCCHKIVTAHGPVVKDAGKALGHSLARECSQFRKRRCRASTLPLATLLMNQVNGALRADDIVHETGRHRARDRRHEVVQ
jgi:hypothetical protein